MSENAKLIPGELLNNARAMRHSPVSTEAKLWKCLRTRQIGGYKFRRQHPCPPFIADFYCHEAKFIVETDGDSHLSQVTYDASRTQRLMRDGINVIRFSNLDVHYHLDSVLEEILSECGRLVVQNHPHPNPLPVYRERG